MINNYGKHSISNLKNSRMKGFLGQRGDDQRSKLCRINKNSSSTLQDSTSLQDWTVQDWKPHRLTIILWWLEIISTTSNDSLPVTPQEPTNFCLQRSHESSTTTNYVKTVTLHPWRWHNRHHERDFCHSRREETKPQTCPYCVWEPMNIESTSPMEIARRHITK